MCDTHEIFLITSSIYSQINSIISLTIMLNIKLKLIKDLKFGRY